MTKKISIFLYSCVLSLLVFWQCQTDGEREEPTKKQDSLFYYNHSDSASYAGMNTCKLCHQDIYNTFIKTGMGKSFDIAHRQKSSGDFTNAHVNDKTGNFQYKAFWENDSLFFSEYRLSGKDTLHSRTEQVNFIIGSGQHTNSHIHNSNGYLTQMPMTFYTQKNKWDLPPGFENGFNTHFSRKIGLECMSCHNGFPEFVMGSENKYKKVAQGIDCERCHGPGSIHVKARSSGEKIDTSLYIDRTIVNPAKLSVDLQFDLCQRCHLQGNAVLKEGKSFYDFKPGMKLSNFISVFLPKYKNADDEFIMASHADRLKQSTCFIRSLPEQSTGLKPYKNALTCVTCHNPHVSVKETNKSVFNEACISCHHSKGKAKIECTEKKVLALMKTDPHEKIRTNKVNCVSCHMPLSGSIDIPHVSVHDHYIRKPINKTEKEKIKTFVGLFSINEKNPDRLTRAKAYIEQYSKFDQNKYYLDSARKLLNDHPISELEKNLKCLIQLNFIEQKYDKITKYINQIGEDKCHNLILTKSSYDNSDAWAAYHIAESFLNTGNTKAALKWFNKAVALAPYVLDFRNKKASALAALNDLKAAMTEYGFILKENPEYTAAYTNLGYLMLLKGDVNESLKLYKTGLKTDPDNEALLLNLAGYYAFMKDKKNAVLYLNRILKRDPGNQKAKAALQQINKAL